MPRPDPIGRPDGGSAGRCPGRPSTSSSSDAAPAPREWRWRIHVPHRPHRGGVFRLPATPGGRWGAPGRLVAGWIPAGPLAGPGRLRLFSRRRRAVVNGLGRGRHADVIAEAVLPHPDRELPVGPLRAANPYPTPFPSPIGGGARGGVERSVDILLDLQAAMGTVDDEPDLLAELEPLLERAGFQVLTAGNGEEALKRIIGVASPAPGWRLDSRYPPHPVGTPTERAFSLQEGADDYLNKPLEPMELAARIQAVLRRTRRGNPR